MVPNKNKITVTQKGKNKAEIDNKIMVGILRYDNLIPTLYRLFITWQIKPFLVFCEITNREKRRIF